ncbi:MAG: DNA primase [Dehalococcoidia bacterium]|nr:DNA primase [Dehalococcoidia bacterium]
MSITSEVKQRIDIVEVISAYVAVQKAGRNFKALCPFHSEKHPSFFVFPEQQTWHCFGACGTGGDVFSFVMKKEGVDFGEALRLLAQRAGVTLSSPGLSGDVEDKRKETLSQINDAAAEYFHHLLLNTQAGEAARNYLDKRKITAETIRGFRLGFSHNSWDALKKFMMTKGYEEQELIEAGLIIEKEAGKSYDRFRNRLVFPICDIQNRVIGFGARALDESLPKYVNSPQTPIFDKSSSLYGINKAKSTIKHENLVIIVEGYMDVLTAHQYGWQNVVASMGTSITEKQPRILKGLTKNITLALDADLAGQEAAFRGVEVLTHSLDKKTTSMLSWSKELANSVDKGGEPPPSLAGLVKHQNTLDAEIKIILLPPGKDPDEVIKEGLTLWQNLVEQALPVLDFALATVTSKVDINKAKDKSLAVQKLLPLIREIKDPVQQGHYVLKLADTLKVRGSDITAALRKSPVEQRRPRPTRAIEQSRFIHQLISSPIEEYCLALLLQYPELQQVAQGLSVDHFESTENREIFTKWQCAQNISELREKLDANLLENLDYLINKPILDKNGMEQHALNDCILRLQESLSKRLEAKRELMFNLTREKEGVNAELAKLDEQGISSSEQLKEVFTKREKLARQEDR